MKCIFCRIVAGDVPASIVHEDPDVLAFMDIAPFNEGHVLVVPRRHCAALADVDDDLADHVFRVARRVAQAIRDSGLRCEGINLFVADGAAAFQEVFHFHMHVFPRFKGDAFRLKADPKHPSRTSLDETASVLRTRLP